MESSGLSWSLVSRDNGLCVGAGHEGGPALRPLPPSGLAVSVKQLSRELGAPGQ